MVQVFMSAGHFAYTTRPACCYCRQPSRLSNACVERKRPLAPPEMLGAACPLNSQASNRSLRSSITRSHGRAPVSRPRRAFKLLSGHFILSEKSNNAFANSQY